MSRKTNPIQSSIWIVEQAILLLIAVATVGAVSGFVTTDDDASARCSFFVYGSEFKKGDSGMSNAVTPQHKTHVNKPIIIKDKFEVSGSDATAIGWVEISGEEGQNGYLWYLKAEGDTRARFTDYLEMTMLEAEKTKRGLTQTADIATDFIPGDSETKDIISLGSNIGKGDYVGAGIDAASLVLGAVPIVGDAARQAFKRSVTPKKVRKAFKLFVQREDGGLYPLFVDADKRVPEGVFTEANFPKEAFQAPNGKLYVPSKGAKREARTEYYDPDGKKITKAQYDELGDNAKKQAKVKKIKKPYARKIQILTVGEQRAKVMGKTQVVNIFKQGKLSLKRKHNAKK